MKHLLKLSDWSKEEILENNLNVIPLNTIVDGVEYHDTVDIDANKLGELMKNGAKVSTSTPTIVEIEDYFDNFEDKTFTYLCISNLYFYLPRRSSMYLHTFLTPIRSPFQLQIFNLLNHNPHFSPRLGSTYC